MRTHFLRAILATLLVAPAARAELHPDDFVWPGHGIPADRSVWGHRDGLRIGLAPAPGPHGLIRIYAPYLGQEYPRMVNFLSIEPAVEGEVRRGQSELEWSRERPGRRGLVFHASDDLRPRPAESGLAAGNHSPDAGTLSLFVHTEPFRNGAHPIVEIVFRRDRIEEIELVLHAAADSAAIQSCVISATMGNYGLLRRLHLAEDSVAHAGDLWPGESTGRLGFLPWKTWSWNRLDRTPDGRFYVSLSSDAANLSDVQYDPRVTRGWRYEGRLARHYWRAEKDARPVVAVNGRRHYWMSDAPIPGGTAFENFELRMPFQQGQRLWFGVTPEPE